MLPYFFLYWIGEGNQLAKANLFGLELGLETAGLGIIFIVAIITLPLWDWLAKKYSKRKAYIIGIILWIIIEALVLTIKQGQVTYMMTIALFVGIFTSNAHVLPEAMFPDVIDWAELKTSQRREGTYYGAIHFTRKLSSAIAVFLALQILGWTGYTTPPTGAVIVSQPQNTLNAIRFLTGPMIILLLFVALGFTIKYPLTRERQHRIRRSLERRQRRDEQRGKKE